MDIFFIEWTHLAVSLFDPQWQNLLTRNGLVWGGFRKLIYALHQTFEKFFTGAEVQRKAQQIVGVGRKVVYEIDPWQRKVI